MSADFDYKSEDRRDGEDDPVRARGDGWQGVLLLVHRRRGAGAQVLDATRTESKQWLLGEHGNPLDGGGDAIVGFLVPVCNGKS